MVSIMLNVEANQSIEESQNCSLPPWVVSIVVHVTLQKDGSPPDEGGLQKVGPRGKGLQSWHHLVHSLTQLNEVIILVIFYALIMLQESCFDIGPGKEQNLILDSLQTMIGHTGNPALI